VAILVADLDVRVVDEARRSDPPADARSQSRLPPRRPTFWKQRAGRLLPRLLSRRPIPGGLRKRPHL